jgi:hypothetical protein
MLKTDFNLYRNKPHMTSHQRVGFFKHVLRNRQCKYACIYKMKVISHDIIREKLKKTVSTVLVSGTSITFYSHDQYAHFN